MREFELGIPIMNLGGSTISLTYIASESIIPRYDGEIVETP